MKHPVLRVGVDGSRPGTGRHLSTRLGHYREDRDMTVIRDITGTRDAMHSHAWSDGGGSYGTTIELAHDGTPFRVTLIGDTVETFTTARVVSFAPDIVDAFTREYAMTGDYAGAYAVDARETTGEMPGIDRDDYVIVSHGIVYAVQMFGDDRDDRVSSGMTPDDVRDWTSCAYDLFDRLPGEAARVARDRVWRVSDMLPDDATPGSCETAHDAVTAIVRREYLTTDRVASAILIVMRDYVADGIAEEFGFMVPGDYVAYARDVLTLPGRFVPGGHPVEYAGSDSDIAFATVIAAPDDMIAAALGN